MRSSQRGCGTLDDAYAASTPTEGHQVSRAQVNKQFPRTKTEVTGSTASLFLLIDLSISLGIYLGITCVQPVSTPASERRVQAVYIGLYLVDMSAMDPPPATHLFVSDGPQTQPLRSRGTSSNIPGCCPLTRALHGSTGMFMPSSSFLSDPRMGLPDHLPKPLQGRPSWDNAIVQIIHNVFSLSFPNLLLLKCPLSVNVMSQKRSFPSFFSINLLYTKYTKSPIFWSCFK